MGLLDFFSAENGQQRRKWLNQNADKVGNAIDYMLGPTGIPERVGIVNELLSPMVGVEEAAKASQEMFAPGKTPGERAQAGLRMGTEVAGVAAPALAAKALSKGAAALPRPSPAAEPTTAVVDTLTGGLLGMPGPIDPYTALKGAGQDAKATGQAVLDRMNQPGPMPTTGALGGNMFDTFDHQLTEKWFNKAKDDPLVYSKALDNVLKNQGYDTNGAPFAFLDEHGLIDHEAGQLLDPNAAPHPDAGKVTISPPPPGMLEAAKKAQAEADANNFDDLLFGDDSIVVPDFEPAGYDPLFTPSAGESLHMAGIPPNVLNDLKQAFGIPDDYQMDDKFLNDLFADAKTASFDKGDLSDETTKFLKNNILQENGKATFAGPIFGKSKSFYKDTPQIDIGAGPQDIQPLSSMPGWVKEELIKQKGKGYLNTDSLLPEELNDLMTDSLKKGSLEGDLGKWADEYLSLGMDENGNVKTFINQTAADDMFDTQYTFEDNPFKTKTTWDAKHKPAAPTYTWQQLYDQLYEQEMKTAMESGDPYGPTSWDEVKEKLLQDEQVIDDYVTSEVDNYYNTEWIPEQLQQDFITGKEMTDEEILDLLTKADPGDIEDHLGFKPESLDMADLYYAPDPGQLAFPGIGHIPEGPSAAGQELIDEFKNVMGEFYFDVEGKLDDVGDNVKGDWGQFDPDDYDTMEGLGDYYGVKEMAKEGMDDLFYDDDQIASWAQNYLGETFDDEVFNNNLMANYAKNGQMDDDVVMDMLNEAGFGDDYDAALPDDVAHMFGMGVNGPAPGVGEGTTFKRIAGGTDIDELLDAAATAAPGSAAFQRLMDYAAPRTDNVPANEQALAKDIQMALMARIGNLEDAAQQGYDLDLPLYHGGKTRFYQPEVRNLGAIYTATSPSGARAGAYGKGTPYMHPMLFRGNVFGRGDLPASLNDRIVQDLAANAQKADPEQSRNVLKQSLLDWSAGTDDALTENEAELVSNQLLTTYFSEGGDVPGLSRPKPDAPITARDAAERKAQHSPGTRYPNNLPGYSYAESGSYGSSQGAYQRALMKLGFDAAPIRDEVVGNYPTERSISVFRPEMERSPLAKFDRNRQDENNMFASVPAAGLLGLLALLENQKQEQKTDPSLLGGGL